jgi:amidase
LDYTRTLDPDGLRGARIGVARKSFSNQPAVKAVQEQFVRALRDAGAVLVDPVELPKLASSYEVMVYEFKAGLNDYFASLGPDAPVKSVKELIEFNEKNRDKELCWFGQETLIGAESRGPLTDPKYLEALAACRRSSREEGVDALMAEHRLDAIVAATTSPAHVTDFIYGDRDTGGSSSPAAVAGYPNITLPGGFVGQLPIGISFFGRAWSEPLLLRLAYGFEQTTQHRHPPHFLPTLGT